MITRHEGPTWGSTEKNMKSVFILFHNHRLPDGEDDVKL